MFITILLIICSIFFSWLAQNASHELSHLWVAWRQGWKPLEFRPYPVKRHGRWFFAYCRWQSDGTEPPALLHIAPFINGMILGVLYLTIALLLMPHGRWYLFFIPSTMAFFDAGFFWWGYFCGSNFCDGKKFRMMR